MTINTIKPQEITKNQTLGKVEGILEYPYVFKILNISIFDGAWSDKKLPFNFIKFGRFQIFELY